MDFRGTKNLGILIWDAQAEIQTLTVYRWQWGDVVLVVSGTFNTPLGKET